MNVQAGKRGTDFALSALMELKAPRYSGWQRCPNCVLVSWITPQVAVKDDRVADVWKCPTCRHEWPIEQQRKSA